MCAPERSCVTINIAAPALFAGGFDFVGLDCGLALDSVADLGRDVFVFFLVCAALSLTASSSKIASVEIVR